MHDVCQGNAVGSKVISGGHSLVQRVPAKSKGQWFYGREERDLGLESRCKRIQE